MVKVGRDLRIVSNNIRGWGFVLDVMNLRALQSLMTLKAQVHGLLQSEGALEANTNVNEFTKH